MVQSPLATRAALAALLCSACAASSTPTAPQPKAETPIGFPRTEHLAAAPTWRAEVALDLGEVGIWTVATAQLLPQYAAAEVIGLDDLGRTHVLVPYAGRWTHYQLGQDNSWLGGIAFGDVDPRVPGAELYTGAESGAVYQVVGHADGLVDNRRAARIEGRAVHTLVAAELDRDRAGLELLAFTEPPAIYLLSPRERSDGFDVTQLSAHHGRVRDAVVLPGKTAEGTDRVALVSRSGALEVLDSVASGPRFTPLFEVPTGLGRVALSPSSTAERVVLYTTADDGLIHRHEGPPMGPLRSEVIYVGPTGPRGVVAGRFHEDPAVESIAVFGYAARVELLTRPKNGKGPWKVESLFTDRGAGHWLAKGEYDGRNTTDELLLSGYGARIVMLAREPGYGMAAVATAP